MKGEIRVARKHKDWRNLWECSQALGCTNRGSKKRHYEDIKRMDPIMRKPWRKKQATEDAKPRISRKVKDHSI